MLFDRCIVTHAARRPPEVPALPAVGLILEKGRTPRLTVIAKLTFDISGEEVRLAEAQERLSAGTISAEGDLLRYPSDFVTARREASVMVVGAAWSDAPSPQIACEVEIAGVHARFLAIAGRPSAWIPLHPAYLRSPDGSAPVYLGPSPAGDTADSLEGLGHPDLDTPLLAPDVTLRLVGLSPRGRERALRLPGLAPRALVMADWGPQEAPLRCDTLWVDTEAERAVAVYRGAVFATRPGALDVKRIAVALEPAGRDRRWAEILREQQGGVLLRPDSEERARNGARLELDDDDAELLALSTWVADAPDPRLTLEEYARVSVALRAARGRAARDEALRSIGFGEAAWALEERAWAERLATGAARGDASLARRLDELCAAAAAGPRPAAAPGARQEGQA